MAKDEKKPDGYQKITGDIKAGRIGSLYVFYGEENTLRDHVMGQIKKQLVNESFAEFNYRRFQGPAVDPDALAVAIDAIPMMAERSLIEVWDYPFWKDSEAQRERMAAILSDVPDYCCLIFVYDQEEFGPDRRMKVVSALLRHGEEVEFRVRTQDVLLKWIRRQFRELDRDIDVSNSEYLMFLCGTLMSTLRQEISKIAHYAREPIVTREDIDAVATPTVEAIVFHLTDALSERDLNRAASVLAGLTEQKREEPINLLGLIGGSVRNLYLASLMQEQGRTAEDLQKALNYRSAYPARKLMNCARKLTPDRCMRNVRLCAEADLAMKQVGADRLLLLEQLIVRLCGRA